MIIDHTHPDYIKRWENAGNGKHNGAYYYSLEIVRNIIPNVKTDRHWMTINIPVCNRVPQFTCYGADHMIVFIHNNKHPEHYDWLQNFKDLVLVCGIPETCKRVAHLGRAIYLPLSIDVAEVRQYERPKTKETAFVGRRAKRNGISFSPDVDYIEGLPRPLLLEAMAEYKNIYAVGRTAIEAKALGCNILPYDKRFPDVDRWQVLDNQEASKILQKELDKIDG